MAPKLSHLTTDALQPTSISPAALHRGTSGSPLSDDDTLMDWDGSSPPHASVSPTTPSSHSPLKRKQFVMDYVFLSPPTPRRSLRHIGPQVTELSQPLERTFRDAGTSPPPESPSDRDSFVADMESCLDSILNQLAEETQRRAVLQQYASFASVPDSPAEEIPASSPTPTDFFLNSSDAISDDELSQNMFEIYSLNLKPESSIGDETDVDVGLGVQPDSNALRDVVADDDLPHLDGFPSSVRELEPDSMRSPAEQRGSLENEGNVYLGGPEPLNPPTIPTLEFDTWWAQLNEIDNDDELWSIPEQIPSHDSKSRCPCNQCSPQVTSYPDNDHPSRHSHQEIHRLFLSSPFAHRKA
ncbi:hypothetical protein C8F04DRAFT_1136322 [Mycena alexandri]|uniref:Uncharacterized protein n=1 Tax=Mycena alexandri TaxID=1745969 RepID=A0AAD6WRV1_9AGAR|nr:hypothetical protein C8F04DRAFT_1136322 [Mycena alexandri]